MEFYKYHSLGNDYLIYDCNKNQEALDKEKIVKLCNRNYGIGAFPPCSASEPSAL